MSDLLDQLKQHDVPPLPERFEQRVHARVNEHLLARHLVEFVVQALPFAWMHFAQALVGLAQLTLTGKYGDPPRQAGEEERF